MLARVTPSSHDVLAHHTPCHSLGSCSPLNHPSGRGRYSDLASLPNGKILAVWEDGSHPLSLDTDGLRGGPPNPDSGNFFAMQVGTKWCKLG